MFVIATVFAATTAACLVPPAETTAQLALGYAAFDGQNSRYGWRTLSGSGCTDAAVALLTTYAETNVGRLTREQQRELAFHIGQTLALEGRDREALRHFERAQSAEATPEWRNYVGATIAFLRRDAAALATAREAYAAIAPGSMRLRIIDGFMACPANPYAKAAHCKM